MTSLPVRLGAVILAAGSSTRFGSLKQLLDIDGEPMVRSIARRAMEAGLTPVVVVVGFEGSRVTAALEGLGVHVTANPSWITGMGSSLSIGVRAVVSIEPTLDSIMVLLADQPGIRVTDLQAMITAHIQAPDRIVACANEETLGPPCIFPLRYRDELIALDGHAGARHLLERHAGMVDGFALPAAFTDIDTPPDYVAWKAGKPTS